MILSQSEFRYDPRVMLFVAAFLLIAGVLFIVLEDSRHAERVRTVAGILCILGAIVLGILAEGRL